jgi:hypothetical protein
METWHFHEWTTVIGLFIGFLAAVGTIALASLAFKTIMENRRSEIRKRPNEWARKYLNTNTRNSPARSKSAEMYVTMGRNRLQEIIKSILTAEIDAAKLSKEVFGEIKDIEKICKDGLNFEYSTEEEREIIINAFDELTNDVDEHLRQIIEKTA